MSGPKYSTAIIRERIRLERLKRQLEEKIEKEKCQEIRKQLLSLMAIRDHICKDPVVIKCQGIITEAESLAGTSAAVRKMRDILRDVVALHDLAFPTNGDSKTLQAKYDALKHTIGNVKSECSLLDEIKTVVETDVNESIFKRNLDSFKSQKWEDTGRVISTIPKPLQEIYFEIIELLASTDGGDSDKKAVIDCIMNSDFDIQYKINQLKARRNALLVERNSTHDTAAESSMAVELRCLYNLLGKKEKSLPTTLSDLEKELGEAKQALLEKEKADYISQCIHKVFQEKGYLLVDDVVLSSASGNVSKELYGFGDESYISVSHSQTGQMLFEVVGNGKDGELTAGEREKLEKEMIRFCPDYAVIKKALEDEYGITLEKEHLCPPDKKYARAIKVSTGDQRRGSIKKKVYHEN